MQLDHAVINTRYSLDAAETAFADLGFQLTARGRHSLGSINHLMMFDTDYLELIGLPAEPAVAGQPVPTRSGVSDAPAGINGLVFKTTDAAATFAHLQSLGMAGDPPKSFSRPVDLGAGTPPAEASFTTVHVRPDCFPAGRVYFCQHHTPELVWRSEWQQHPNGSQAIAAMTLVATDPEQQAARFASLLDAEPAAEGDQGFRVAATGFSLLIVSPARYLAQFGALASAPQGRDSFFGALRINCDTIDALRTIAARLPDSETRAADAHQSETIVVRQAQFDTVLEFVYKTP